MNQQINLYNPALERKRDLASLPMAAGLWAACLVLLAMLMVGFTVRTNNLESSRVAAETERDRVRAELDRLSAQLAARQPNPELAAEVERLDNALASRQEVVALLQAGVIGDRTGFSEHLKAFARQSFNGLWLTGVKVAAAGQDVVLEGRALQPQLVPNYLRRLNREDVMQGQAFAELEIRRPAAKDEDGEDDVNYVEFRLSTLALQGGAAQ